MARIRTIKPEFFRSPDTAAVDFPVRIFYQALWCWADDFGVGETNLNGLLGFAFPDEDNFTAQDLRRFCADVARHYGVTFYSVRGRHYYAIPSWEKHQKLERRADRRKHPLPDDPDAMPDQRFYDCADSAPTKQRSSRAESGGFGAGKGTGEREGEVKRRDPADAPLPLDVPTEQKSHDPAQLVTIAAYEKTGKSFKFIAVRAMTKWLLDRGETQQAVEDAIVGVHELGKPITKQTLDQWIKGSLRGAPQKVHRDDKSGMLVER